jgi:DNA-binding NtrC family response regulator
MSRTVSTPLPPVQSVPGPRRPTRVDDDTGVRSSAHLRARAQARRFAADRKAAILIEGESGTGKTRLAREIHAASPRALGSFRHVVLSTLDDGIAGSELFGHVPGAFTDARSNRTGHFVTAHGGTLFLDEIGKASRAVQQKLLHAIEYGEIRPVGSDRDVRVDVRIVAASNLSLEELVAKGEFLPDLHARLSAFRIRLPTLRERRADIPALVTRFVDARAADCGYREAPAVDPALVRALQRARWPNNIRQLDASIHRLLVDAEGARVLTLEHCIDDLSYLRGHLPRDSVALTERRVADAIRSAGSIAGAARMLGVDRTTVHRFQRRARGA